VGARTAYGQNPALHGLNREIRRRLAKLPPSEPKVKRGRPALSSRFVGSAGTGAVFGL
jgi:hypothetical protein